MKYVLMFVGSTEDQDSFDRLPPAQRAAAYEGANKWFEEQSRAGRLVGREELQAPRNSTTVRIKNGKAIVTDGPYIEATEIVGGFAIVHGNDLDHALPIRERGPPGPPRSRP